MHPERLILRIRSEACTAEPTNSKVCVSEVCLSSRWIIRFIVLRSIPGL